jgi:hypothetical protein
MLKARSSFPSVIYEENRFPGESLQKGRIANVMARYFARIDALYQTETMRRSEFTGSQTDAARPDAQEYTNIISESRLKVKKISAAFNKFDNDMKKLQDHEQLVSTVRKNLDSLGRNFWDWLLHNPDGINESASSNSSDSLLKSDVR